MFYCFLIKKKNLILTAAIFIAFIMSIAVIASKNDISKEKDAITVPILMYHSINDNPKRFGKYVVPPQTLESDIDYLIKNGYTTVFVDDLINYVYNNVPLPEKPVIISFDDGYYNNMIYIPPILKKYNSKATIAVVGEFTDKFSNADSHNVNYSHLTWDDLKELSQSKSIEFSNHTYSMHTTSDRFGCFKKKSESIDIYRENLTSDVMKLQNSLKEKAGIECDVFTYPYGKICESSVEILKELGFRASLSCYEKTNHITKDKDSLYLLGRFNRPYGISTENFMKKNKIY